MGISILIVYWNMKDTHTKKTALIIIGFHFSTYQMLYHLLALYNKFGHNSFTRIEGLWISTSKAEEVVDSQCEFESPAKFKFQSKMSVLILPTHQLLFAGELDKDKDKDMQLLTEIARLTYYSITNQLTHSVFDIDRSNS